MTRPATLAALAAVFTCALALADEYKDAKFAKFEKTDKGNVTLEVKVKDDTKAVTVLASPTAYKVFDADGKAVKKLEDRAAVLKEGLVADVKTEKRKDGTELVVEIRLKK